MDETKSYILLSGKFRRGDKVFKPGDTVELTDAQAKAFADAIQSANAKAEPVITGTKQMAKLAAKKVAEEAPVEEEEEEGEEQTEVQAKSATTSAAKPAIDTKPTQKPVTNKQASK